MKKIKGIMIKAIITVFALMLVLLGFMIWQHRSYVRLISAVEKNDNVRVEQLLKRPYRSLDRQSGPFPWIYLTKGGGACSPLEAACENGNYEAAKMLIDRGADASVVHEGCFSLLYLSMQSTEMDDYKLVRLLVENGADPYGAPSQHNDDESSLSVCAGMHCYGDNSSYDENRAEMILKIYKYLESKCGVKEIKMDSGWPPLKSAVATNNLPLVKYLIDQGEYDTNQQDDYGETCVFGVGGGELGKNDKIRTQIFYVLMENGADVYIKNKEGKTVYDCAKEANDTYLMKLLGPYI